MKPKLTEEECVKQGICPRDGRKLKPLRMIDLYIQRKNSTIGTRFLVCRHCGFKAPKRESDEDKLMKETLSRVIPDTIKSVNINGVKVL